MAEYVELKRIMEFPIRRDHYDRENGDPHFINGIETMMEYIETLPAVDAVPVIRCKDCKWFGKSGCAILIVDESDKPKEDDLCSWAERKEECSL